MRHVQIWHQLFLWKDIKVFAWLSNLIFFRFMTKVKPNKGNETKSDRRFSMGHIHIWHHIFLSKHIKVFQWLSISNCPSCRTKVKSINENETKSDVFSLDIFKSDKKSFLLKNIKIFQKLWRSKYLSFMIKVNPQNGTETNQTFFCGTYSNLTLFSIDGKILNNFNDF